MFGEEATEEGMEAVLKATIIGGSQHHNTVQLGVIDYTADIAEPAMMDDDQLFLVVNSAVSDADDTRGDKDGDYSREDDNDDDKREDSDDMDGGDVVHSLTSIMPNRTSSSLEDANIPNGLVVTKTQSNDSRKKGKQGLFGFSKSDASRGSNLSVSAASKEGTDQTRTYHPALKAAVFSEGQEAMWYEDEYSTLSSVTASVVSSKPIPTRKPARKSLISFLPRGMKSGMNGASQKKNGQEDLIVAPPAEPVIEQRSKAHIKKKLVKKSIVLLPQEGENPGVKTLVDANTTQEAVENMIKARKLLNAALVLNGSHPSSLRESEQMAKVAFAHATAARRLMAAPNEEVEGKQLDDVLSLLAEQGEHAASQHQKIVFSQSFEDEDEGDGDNEAGKTNTSEGGAGKKVIVSHGRLKKKSVISTATGYASRAVHYLESILPKNVPTEKFVQHRRGGIDNALSDDFWSDAGISTLGMRNDTFEYGFTCQHPTLLGIGRGNGVNMDLVSLSSLNEILDGPFEDENDDQSEKKTDVERRRSPRIDIPVIDVPRHTRTLSTKNHRYGSGGNRPGRFLGLVSPLANNPILRKKSPLDQAKPNKSTTAAIGEGDDGDKQREANPNSNQKQSFKNHSTDEKSPDDDRKIQPIKGDSKEDFTTSEKLDGPKHVFDGNKAGINPLLSLAELSASMEMSDTISADVDRYKSANTLQEIEPKRSVEDLKVVTSQSSRYVQKLHEHTKDENEWDDGVFIRNINEHMSTSFVEDSGSAINGPLSAGALSLPEESDWDDTYIPGGSETSMRVKNRTDNHHQEPVGKTPQRDTGQLEEAFHHDRNIAKKPSLHKEERHVADGTLTRKKKADDVVKSNSDDRITSERKPPAEQIGPELKIRENQVPPPRRSEDRVTSPYGSKRSANNVSGEAKVVMRLELDANPLDREEVPRKRTVAPPPQLSGAKDSNKGREKKREIEDMSTAKSEGSKTKIFGRIVGMLGQQKKSLVPTAVIEETYIVQNGKETLLKSTSNKLHSEMQYPVNKTITIRKEDTIPATVSQPVVQKKKMLPTRQTPDGNVELTAGKAKTAKKQAVESSTHPLPKKIIASNSTSDVNGRDDDTIHKAVTNGNLHAMQSNDEDSEAPSNYLEILLRKKAKEERKQMRQVGDGGKVETKRDADSFVAAIVGQRHQEAPGVALEGVAYRDPERDPVEDDSREIRNLAPTPRRPEKPQMSSLNDSRVTDYDPPLNDQRERQRMITERLYGASFSHDEEAREDKLIEGDDKEKKYNTSHLQTAPTVASAESYVEQGQDAPIPVELEGEEEEKLEQNSSKSSLNCSRRLSFLPGLKKLVN